MPPVASASLSFGEEPVDDQERLWQQALQEAHAWFVRERRAGQLYGEVRVTVGHSHVDVAVSRVRRFTRSPHSEAPASPPPLSSRKPA